MAIIFTLPSHNLFEGMLIAVVLFVDNETVVVDI